MSSRAEAKASAREERVRLEQADAVRAARTRRLRLLAIVGGVAAVAVVVAILASRSGTTEQPKGAAAASSVNALFAGIPQDGVWLGKPDAPVVLHEFVDLQCPFCAQFSRDALPAIVKDYVRTGKVRLRLQPISILGADSEKAAKVAAAATLQNRGWQFSDLFYANQGQEGTGYVTGGFLRGIAQDTQGLDATRAVADGDGAKAAAVLRDAQAASRKLGISSTPSFALARRGEAPKPLEVTSLEASAFTGPIDQLLAGGLMEGRLRTVAIVLSALGILVAGYLTYVHYADLKPICAGGGGGCEKVQSSEQSRLLGVPVALLGLLSYVVLLGCALARSEAARMLGAATALAGFGFSAYLTYESITVIDATCQWCLASATVMTLLAVVCTARLLAAEPAVPA